MCSSLAISVAPLHLQKEKTFDGRDRKVKFVENGVEFC